MHVHMGGWETRRDGVRRATRDGVRSVVQVPILRLRWGVQSRAYLLHCGLSCRVFVRDPQQVVCLFGRVRTLQNIESFKTAIRPSKEERARLNLEGAADGRRGGSRSASLRRSIESEYRT